MLYFSYFNQNIMKTFLLFLLSLILSANLFSQLDFLQVERFNKKFEIVISDPFIATHWPVGLIYKDTTDNAFTKTVRPTSTR